MRAYRTLAALAALLVTGCSGAALVMGTPEGTQQAAGAGPTAGRFALTDHDVEEIVRDSSAARQIAPKKPVAVVRLDIQKFRERLAGGHDDKQGGDKLSQEAAFLLGFDFVPQPGKRGGIATISEVLQEQVVGYYDLTAEKVFIPDVHLKSQDELLEQEAVLAHEVHHALQAQHFGKPPPAQSEDESLAQLALIEGDAQVAMGAWLGARAGAPVGRTLRRIVEVTKQVPLSSVTRGEENRSLDKALDLTRKRLEFPYRDGMLFVSDVYRAGGFPLVDKIYASPPRSTARDPPPREVPRRAPPAPRRRPQASGAATPSPPPARSASSTPACSWSAASTRPRRSAPRRAGPAIATPSSSARTGTWPPPG